MSMVNAEKLIKEEYPFLFTICTFVTDHAEYQEMLTSFVEAGFTKDTCQFVYIDNSKGNTYEAFEGINLFLSSTKGKYTIICHQDILIDSTTMDTLLERIKEIEEYDPKWAVLSNAGGINLKHTAMHVYHPSKKEHLVEPLLPLKAISVDESFMLINSDVNLSLSSDIKGFHLYGTDICLMADILGYSAYIIDYNIIHKSTGNPGNSFSIIKKQLRKKYKRALRGRFMGTTFTRFYISGNPLSSWLYNTGIIMFLARQFYKLFLPKRKYKNS